MTPKDLFGRPRILAGFAIATLGGIFPSLIPYVHLERLWEVFGMLVLVWLLPLASAVVGVVVGGLVASSDAPLTPRPSCLPSFAAANAQTSAVSAIIEPDKARAPSGQGRSSSQRFPRSRF